MTNYLDAPRYIGIWESKKEFAPFFLWKTGEDSGKSIEYYQDRLVRADISEISDESSDFFMNKKYLDPIGNLTKSDIIFRGVNYQEIFVQGDWAFEDEKEKIQTGQFYMGTSGYDSEIPKRLGELYFKILFDRIKEEQKAFPFLKVYF